MQTRKRAKSITFGKPKKEEELKPKAADEEVSVSAAAPEEDEVKTPEKVEEPKESKVTEEVHEPTEAAKKVLEIEDVEKPKEEKDELSESLDDKEAKSSDLSATPEAVTPADDFITDTEPDKESAQEEPKVEEPKAELSSGLSASTEPTLSTPVLESESKSDAAPETLSEGSTSSEELSATPPPSAFSLQEGGSGDGVGDGGGGKKRNFLVYFLVIALFSFILGIGAMAVLTSGLLPVSLPKDLPFTSQLQTAMNASPTAAPTEKPQPTVAPTEKPLDLNAYTVSVLNGSGIRGKAAEVKTSLTTAGFKVGTTGNAATSDFEATQISAKKDVDEAYINKLKEELEKDFKVEVAAAPAPASQGNDVVVTIGKDTVE